MINIKEESDFASKVFSTVRKKYRNHIGEKKYQHKGVYLSFPVMDSDSASDGNRWSIYMSKIQAPPPKVEINIDFFSRDYDKDGIVMGFVKNFARKYQADFLEQVGEPYCYASLREDNLDTIIEAIDDFIRGIRKVDLQLRGKTATGRKSI